MAASQDEKQYEKTHVRALPPGLNSMSHNISFTTLYTLNKMINDTLLYRGVFAFMAIFAVFYVRSTTQTICIRMHPQACMNPHTSYPQLFDFLRHLYFYILFPYFCFAYLLFAFFII